MDSFILSTTFMIAGARGSYSSPKNCYISHRPLALPRPSHRLLSPESPPDGINSTGAAARGLATWLLLLL